MSFTHQKAHDGKSGNHARVSISGCTRSQGDCCLAFRNGPIEIFHAGKVCPTCDGDPEYSRITPDEMRSIMKNAVDHMYTYLLLKENDKAAYEVLLTLGERYTTMWDKPVLTKAIKGISDSPEK
jgi:hypothetical protein